MLNRIPLLIVGDTNMVCKEMTTAEQIGWFFVMVGIWLCAIHMLVVATI